jgi:hypothetical protein
MPAMSSRLSVPVPAGQGWEIWYGVFPEPHVPVSRSETTLHVEEHDAAEEHRQPQRCLDQVTHLPAGRLTSGNDGHAKAEESWD